MDAFDTRMQTFGGAQKSMKKDRQDKFMAEKRGFIRASNGYTNNNPLKITQSEIKSPIKGPGPAFETNYDNRYRDKTSFADAYGRVKEDLNINSKLRSEVLSS